jgi:hypothetical protein
MRIQITKDLLGGVLFALIGLGTIYIGSGYKLGTAANMGPGYFPIMLGGIVAVIGAAMIVIAARAPESSEAVASWEIRPLVFVTAAILLFSMLIENAGVIVAVAGLVVVARLGSREGSLLELVVLIAVLIAISVGIFVYGLNIPLRLRPW